mgnify:CR=1 FL=1
MAKKKTPTKRTTKKKPTSKSQAVRDQLAKTPNAAASEIAAAASKASGLSITPSTVYNVKSSKGGTKKRKGRKTSAAKRSGAKQSAKDTSPVEDFVHAGELMFQAVDLVMKAGYKEAKSMVEIANKMVDRIRDKE